MIRVSEIQNHELWSDMLCINLSVCSFVKAEKYGPNPPKSDTENRITGWALQKIPFYVFHRCVNVVT